MDVRRAFWWLEVWVKLQRFSIEKQLQNFHVIRW